MRCTPEQLWDRFTAYQAEVTEVSKVVSVVAKGEIVSLPKERPLTIIGFCVYANISKSTFYEYKDKAEFSDIHTRIREIIEADQTEGAMLDVYNPAVTSRLLGLVDKTDITSEGRAFGITDLTIKSISDKIDEAKKAEM